MADTSISDLLDAARLSGLITTPKGRIVARVSRLNTAGTAYRSELAELIDDRVVTLTRGNASIGSVALAEDGSTLFTSKRVGEDGKEADDAQLWALPPRGEARELASRPGGFGKLHLGLGGGRLIAELTVHSQASGESEHADLSKKRKEAKVTAALTSEFPTRYWDQDLGPARQVLAVADLPEDLWTAEATSDADSADEQDDTKKQLLHFRHVTMPAGRLQGWIADRAGARALVSMSDSFDDLLGVYRVYLLDLAGSEEPRLVFDASAEYEFGPVEFSPDGSRVVVGQYRTWTETESMGQRLFVWDVESGELTDLWPEFDHWAAPVWLDDETLVAGSDDQGRGSVWIGGLGDTAPRRLAGGPEQELAFSGVGVAGDRVAAVASGIARAPHGVSIDPGTGAVEKLANPVDDIEQTGSLTEVTTTAEDGSALRAWLRVPDGEGPHPLVVFAHGGPWGSWNAWTYRWNPNPFVAAGYAVLMPDPAISTGYGQAMIDRGQHELGGAPFTDIMALTDVTVQRDDIDETRTALGGGSYGGYMANWVAGHTGDRFKCIVTHASLWDTDSMGHTTDNAGWEAPMRTQNLTYNPKDSVADIVVPMLVIHGDKDYRVPIAQGHHLWYDLNAFSSTPRDENGRTRHRYLYFPDEGHWILGRGNAQVWYETFIAFLDEHVRGKQWERPATLG